MWFNFIKIKKNSIFQTITHKDLKKKTKLYNEKKIINIISSFIKLNKILLNSIKSNTLNLIIFYASVKNITNRNNLSNYNNVLQIKSTKKQLFCTIFNNKKIIFFVSNGFFLKKLMLKKSQKKDSKVSILSLKNVIEFLKKKSIKNLIVNLNFAKSFSTKYIHFIKSTFKNTNVIYVYSTLLNFSKKKFKKIKSIKRKLKKRYIYSV
jgi:hypothetical protein